MTKERRTYVRIPRKDLLAEEALRLTSFDESGRYKLPAQLKDLSENGILFESHMLCPIGSFLRIQLHIPHQELVTSRLPAGHPVSVTGKVVRVEELGEGAYDIGLQFVDVLAGHHDVIKKYLKKLKKR